MTSVPVVFVVDDDPSVRSSLKFLISTVGLQVETFDSAEAALQRVLPDAPSCLVLDVRLRGLSGLDLQHELAARNCQIPIVFITGYGDIPMSVRAMKAGAVEFLTKPFRDQDLLDAVRIALERDRARREREKELAECRWRRKRVPVWRSKGSQWWGYALAWRRRGKWGSGDCFLLSARIVHPFGQRSAISLACDLEDDRPIDQPIEESHRQRAIGHVLAPFVEVDVGHQSGGALLVA